MTTSVLGMNNISRAAQEQDEKLAYAFTAERGIDADARYLREPLLTTSYSRKEDPSKTVFAILSSELSNPIYEVRTAAQQAEWAEKKAICQKRLASELLKFKSNWIRLIESCDEKKEHLLGIMKDGVDGYRIEYDIRLHIVVKSLAYAYLNGDSEYTLDELIELIVNEYNLSYCHFTKPAAKGFLEDFSAVDNVRKSNKSNVVNIPKQQDIFDIPDEVIAFENSEGVTWDLARTTVLLCRSLDVRINQLRNLLVTTNLKGCLKHAINYYFMGSGNKQSSLDQLDLFSEGVEGLVHAADMFIHGTSAKFSTYAEYWVKLKISRFIKNSHNVKIPIHVSDQVGKITRYIRDWKKGNEGSRTLPSKEEVSNATGSSIDAAVWQLAMHRHSGTPHSVSCVNSEGEEGYLSFDMFSEVSIEGDDCFLSAEAQLILKVARDLMSGISRNMPGYEKNRDAWSKKSTNPTAEQETPIRRKPLLTEDQFRIFCLKYVEEKSHAEIAEIIGGNITSKTIRRESDRVMALIRAELNITVKDDADTEKLKIEDSTDEL